MKSILINILKYYRAAKHKLIMYRKNNWGIAQHLKPIIKIKKEWHGSLYGGFYVYPNSLKPLSTIISIGIGKDISFDLSLMKKYNVNIYAFDPTPKSIEWLDKQQNLPTNFKYFDFGISAENDGKMTFFMPKDKHSVSASLQLSEVMDGNDTIEVEMRSFKSLVKLLPTKKISVLKMDIEGSEYDVIETLFDDPEIQIDQLLIEFHDRMFDDNQLKSKKSVAYLIKKGYLIFGSSLSSEEISFIHHSVLQN